MRPQYSEVTFIGSGPSTVYSILWLLEHTNFEPQNIRVIEKTSRFFGEGINSDMKMVFSPTRYGKEIDTKYYFDLIKRYTPHENEVEIPFNYGKIPDYISGNLTAFGIQIEQSDTIHYGTSNGRKMAKKLFDELKAKGIKFNMSTTVEVIGYEDADDSYHIITDKGNFCTDYVFVGVGRAGRPFVDKLAKQYNLKQTDDVFDLGFRLECDFNEELEALSKTFYDFKFFVDDSCKPACSKVRTFCSNPSPYALIAKETILDRTCFNGHTDRSPNAKLTNRANFAVLGTMTHDINEVLQDMTSYGVPLTGLQVSLDELYKIWKKDACPWWMQEQLWFADDMIEILYLENVKLHIPEIKLLCNTPNKIHDRLHLIGDCALIHTGIVPSAISGIRKMEEIFGKRN